jgi:6-phosphogluconolactonase (cycloisomerase 2 family)
MKAPLSIALMISGLASYPANLAAQSRFVYANNDLFPGNNVSAFSVDATGSLTEIPNSPFATGGSGTGGGAYAVNRIVVAGSAAGGNFLYASNGGSQNIAAFAIDPSLGGLTPVPTSPYATGGSGWSDISLAASPNGQFLFAGITANNSIATFSIAADGSLSQVSGIAIGKGAAGMKVSPDGKYLAVGLPGFGSGAVAMFSIASNGSLTMINGVPFADSGAGFLAGVDIDCAGSHLFGGEMTSGNATVDVFNVGSTGVLSRIQGSPFSPGTGTNSNVAVLSPNDQFLFVSNQGSTSILTFGVGSTGALALANSIFLSGGTNTLAGMATDQSGSLLYVASHTDLTDLIYVFNIASDGSLTQAPGSPFDTRQAGGLLSLAAFPSKACAAPPPVQPPPVQPPPVTPPPTTGNSITVKIDIRPSDDDRDEDFQGPAAVINPNSHGKIRVAIFSSATFNAPGQVDMHSLTFGHSGTEQSLAYCEPHSHDVNHDHIPDLVCSFYTQMTNFQKGDTIGILNGLLTDKTTLIQGTDSVKIAH